jgi:hypothetical protein
MADQGIVGCFAGKFFQVTGIQLEAEFGLPFKPTAEQLSSVLPTYSVHAGLRNAWGSMGKGLRRLPCGDSQNLRAQGRRGCRSQATPVSLGR